MTAVKIYYYDSVDKRAPINVNEDWYAAIIDLADQRTPSLEQLQFEIGVRLKEQYRDIRIPFSKSNCDTVKEKYVNDAEVDFVYITACVPVALYYFGEGGGSKELIFPILGEHYSVIYRAVQSLDEFVETIVKPALIKHETREKKKQVDK